MSDHKYIGSGKKVGKFDTLSISICLSDIPKDDIFEYNGKKYCKVLVAAKKETDKFGKSHTVYMDDYKTGSE